LNIIEQINLLQQSGTSSCGYADKPLSICKIPVNPFFQMSHFAKSMSGMFKLRGSKQGMEEQPSFLTYNICKDSAMRRRAKGFGNKRMVDPQAGRAIVIIE